MSTRIPRKNQKALSVPISLVIFIMLSLAFVATVQAENNFHDGGYHAVTDGISASNPQFRIGIVDRILPDATLLLTDGTKLKVAEELFDNPELYYKREVLIYIKNGIPHMDKEGRIVGAVVVVNGSLPEGELENPVETKPSFSAAAFAAKSTVAPPVGEGLRPSRNASLLTVSPIETADFQTNSNGEVSGQVLIA